MRDADGALRGAGLTRGQDCIWIFIRRCPCGQKFQSGSEYILNGESLADDVVEDLAIDLVIILQEQMRDRILKECASPPV